MKSKGLTQAYAMKDLVYNALQTFANRRIDESGKLQLDDGDAQALAQLVKAFDVAQDCVRLAKNKPLPGALKHSERKVKARSPADILSVVADIEQQHQSQNP